MEVTPLNFNTCIPKIKEIIQRSKPFCGWSLPTSIRHAMHNGEHIQGIIYTAIFIQHRIEWNQGSMKKDEKPGILTFTPYYSSLRHNLRHVILVYWIGQATFSRQTARTYKLDTFRNPIQKQLTDLNIKSFSFIMIDEIPWNKNVWAKTIMLVTGFKNWDKKKRQKKKHIYVFFANMRKLLCKIR